MPNVISNSPIKFCCLHEELKILINLFTSFCCFMQFWINFPWWNIKEMHAQVYCTWFWGSMYLASDWVVAFWLLETLPTSQWAGPLWLYNQSTMFTRMCSTLQILSLLHFFNNYFAISPSCCLYSVLMIRLLVYFIYFSSLIECDGLLSSLHILFDIWTWDCYALNWFDIVILVGHLLRRWSCPWSVFWKSFSMSSSTT